MSAAPPTVAQQLARWSVSRMWDDLTEKVRDRLRIAILDSIGCAIGGLGGAPVRALSGYLAEVGGAGRATLIGGGRTSADRAALVNGAAVRYLDFNDTFAAKGESCHPSDNLAPVLAAAELADASGRDLLVALAVAYQVQCRLSEVAPVRARGFDHTVLGMLGMAAGAARARGVDAETAAAALEITGTAFNALRVTRTGRLSHWKGMAAPNAAFGALHALSLAVSGITGPDEMFEGNKGLMDSITGPFRVAWDDEPLDRVLRCSIKKHNAEFHSQSAIDAALRVRAARGFDASGIRRVRVETFATGFHIIGGGEEGDKKLVRTKEDADHSLPYIVSAALLDGEVTPRQYLPDRMSRSDILELLQLTDVVLNEEFSARFPDEMPATVTVEQGDGTVLTATTTGYHGFHTDAFGWDDACQKFDVLTEGLIDETLRTALVDAVDELSERPVSDLTALLARVPREP